MHRDVAHRLTHDQRFGHHRDLAVRSPPVHGVRRHHLAPDRLRAHPLVNPVARILRHVNGVVREAVAGLGEREGGVDGPAAAPPLARPPGGLPGAGRGPEVMQVGVDLPPGETGFRIDDPARLCTRGGRHDEKAQEHGSGVERARTGHDQVPPGN